VFDSGEVEVSYKVYIPDSMIPAVMAVLRVKLSGPSVDFRSHHP
jgi:hypothetical protein